MPVEVFHCLSTTNHLRHLLIWEDRVHLQHPGSRLQQPRCLPLSQHNKPCLSSHALFPLQHDLVGLLDSVPNVDTTEKLQKLSRCGRSLDAWAGC